MLDLTLIWRLSDQLPLAALDTDPKTHAHHIKQRADIMQSISSMHYGVVPSGSIERRSIALDSSSTSNSTPSRLNRRSSASSSSLAFHTLLDHQRAIGLITLSDIGADLSQRFLDDLKSQFVLQHGNDLDQVENPYAFVAFERIIENTAKAPEYSSRATAQHNIGRLKSELSDVRSIVKQNIEEVIGRGSKLQSMSRKSDVLKNESLRLRRSAVYANKMYLWKTYGPAIVTILIVAVVFILYRYVFRF